MIDTFAAKAGSYTVASQARRSAGTAYLWLLAMLGVASLAGLMMLRGTPSWAAIGWICFLVGATATFYEPRYGVYLLIGLGLAGDAILTPWFPFVKNLSSAESLLYVGRATSFSPAEILIVLTFISWLSRAVTQRKLGAFFGPLFWPAVLFGLFVTFGLVYGIATHGDKKIALWEVRVIYYLPAMLILTANLIRTRAQLSTLVWVIIAALAFDTIAGLVFVGNELRWNLRAVEAIAEHSYSIHLNLAFVLAICVWLFRGSRAKRMVLPLLMPLMLFSYFANQRRASFITLTLALILIAFVMFHTHRRLFWSVAPVALVLGAVYLAAFWNSSSGIAMPARAIRSVIAPQAGGRDDSSNLYRVIENLNSRFTIQSRPLTGVGFGNKFYIVAAMPDISFFEWWEYITHNSILWMWMQSGVGGFVAMLVLVGMAIMVGTRAFWRMPGGDLSAIALTMTLYVVMHFVYAYVDMSWEAQSMLLVGTAMGVINRLEHLVATPVPLPPKRWRWQPDPVALPGLRPLNEGPYAVGQTPARAPRRAQRPAPAAPAYPGAAGAAADARR